MAWSWRSRARSPDTCWQGAETVGSVLLEGKEVELLEKEARAAFEALVKKPMKGADVLFLDDDDQDKLGRRGERLVEKMLEWWERE